MKICEYLYLLRAGSQQMIFDDLGKLPQLVDWENDGQKGIFSKLFWWKKKCFATQHEADTRKAWLLM